MAAWLCFGGLGCSSGPGAAPAPTSPQTGSTVGPSATVAAPAIESRTGFASSPRAYARNARQAVSPAYRQGLARDGDDWIFSTNNGLFRTSGDALTEIVRVGPAIPPDLASEGFDHLGDVDIDAETGLLWGPLEKPDKAHPDMRMAAFDARTFRFLGSVAVPQHHASFVAFDPVTRTAFGMDQFSDEVLLQYRMPAPGSDPSTPWEVLGPLPLSRRVARVQGADVDAVRGVVYLATDDEIDGIYAIDLRSGTVHDVAQMSEPQREGEGIDVTDVSDGPFAGSIHVLSAGGIEPVTFEHFGDHEG